MGFEDLLAITDKEIFKEMKSTDSVGKTIEEGLNQKARQKVLEAVESVWGAKFVQFLAELAVLPRSIWKEQLNPAGLFGKKRLNSTCFFTTTETKQLARQGIYQIEQTDTKTFALSSVSIFLLWENTIFASCFQSLGL